MNQTATKISIKGPTDLISTIPLLLGFHPEHSLVVVGLVGGDLRCTFRVDLPGSADHLEHLVDLTAQLCRNECDASILVAYGDHDVAEAALARTATRMDAAGLTPVDRLRVWQGRWFSLDCPDPCCPSTGSPVPESTPVSCEVAVAGGTALPDRAAVAAQLDPVAADRRAAVAEAIDASLLAETSMEWADQRGRDLHAVDHWMGVPELPGPDDIATLALALGDLDLRDYTLRKVAAGRFESDRLDLWIWLTRHLEGELAAPAATVAGFAAYRRGDGVVAAEALSVALRAQPEYRLARLLLTALQAGVPPQALSGIARGAACEAEDG